ncbi:hypothetical protein [Algibacter sp. Ld11]
MKNLNDFSDFQLQAKVTRTVLGGNGDNGITNGNCTLDPFGQHIKDKLGL